MQNDKIFIVDKKIEQLINDKTSYSFNILKEKIEKILLETKMFLVDKDVDSKAIDMYLNKVIRKRNELLIQQEKSKIDNSKETKYSLIESICKKYEFQTKDELMKKIEELEKKPNIELNEINKRS